MILFRYVSENPLSSPKYPEIIEKMKKEMLATLKYDEKGDLIEIPTVEQLENMQYVQVVIKEILRITPIIQGLMATASKVKRKEIF